MPPMAWSPAPTLMSQIFRPLGVTVGLPSIAGGPSFLSEPKRDAPRRSRAVSKVRVIIMGSGLQALGFRKTSRSIAQAGTGYQQPKADFRIVSAGGASWSQDC